MTDLRSLVRPFLRGVEPYDPGPSLAELERRFGRRRIVKLNWNEDLFGLLPGVAEAVTAELANASLYPEQAYTDFSECVARYIGTDPGMIVPAHGIQSLVMSTVSVFVEPGDRVVLPVPTYGLYRQACAAAGAEIVRVPTVGYRFDLATMAEKAAGAKLVFVCDPNNPTGDALSQTEWDRFLAAVPESCLVVVDEAYADYVDPAVRTRRSEAVAAGRPVVVLRTFSKLFGIAGLRLGYALVPPDLVDCYHAAQEPFNVNRLALAAGQACLADAVAVEERRREVVAAREGFAAALKGLGIESWPSQANFLLASPGGNENKWYEGLVRRGFLVRPGSDFAMPGHLRITVGPEALMAELVGAMKEVADDPGAP